jgi:hypothetical protein
MNLAFLQNPLHIHVNALMRENAIRPITMGSLLPHDAFSPLPSDIVSEALESLVITPSLPVFQHATQTKIENLGKRFLATWFGSAHQFFGDSGFQLETIESSCFAAKASAYFAHLNEEAKALYYRDQAITLLRQFQTQDIPKNKGHEYAAAKRNLGATLLYLGNAKAKDHLRSALVTMNDQDSDYHISFIQHPMPPDVKESHSSPVAKKAKSTFFALGKTKEHLGDWTLEQSWLQYAQKDQVLAAASESWDMAAKIYTIIANNQIGYYYFTRAERAEAREAYRNVKKKIDSFKKLFLLARPSVRNLRIRHANLPFEADDIPPEMAKRH